MAVVARALASNGDLAGAIASLEGRFGTRAVVRGEVAERQGSERRFATGTSFDRLTGGGITAGSPLLFCGTSSSGKLALALCAVAGAQRDGGFALWLDPTLSLDAGAAERAGVDLDRLIVVRARTREEVLRGAAAGLRSDGLRLVVVDTGCALAPAAPRVDDLAPIIPLVRGSTSALLVIAERAPARLALSTYRFERVAWESRFARTSGWTFSVAPGASAWRAGAHVRALFHVGALGRSLRDAGLRADIATELAS